MKRGLTFSLVLTVLLLEGVFSLGVSPAFKDFNFKPGMEIEIPYTVFAPEGMEIEIFSEGLLSEYVTLDKKELVGSGNFNAKIKLPEVIENPGLNRIRIGVGQKIDPELASGFIGTRIVVISQVDIYVPLPGRYIEIDLQGDDANIGEPIEFLLNIKSQGKEDVAVVPEIKIFSEAGEIETLTFNNRTIYSQEEVMLKKTLDTNKYLPGNYKARGIVDYGIPALDEIFFRIGTLNINILNTTRMFSIGGLQKFEVLLESTWNDKIDGAYADIEILNGTGVIESFKTSSTDFVAWERKPVVGYFDTGNYSEGLYLANITAVYYGKEQGKSSSKIVDIEFVKKKDLTFWYILLATGVVLFIIALILGRRFRHDKKRKRK